MRRIEGAVEKKAIVFYYGGSAQRIKFYDGTAPKDILSLALRQFSLQHVSHDDVILLDEDGDPLAFSPSHMPSECQVHLQINAVNPNAHVGTATVPPPVGNRTSAIPPTVKSQINAVCFSATAMVPPSVGNRTSAIPRTTADTQLFSWDAGINAAPEIRYQLSSNGRVLEAGSGKFSMPVLCSDRSFKAGSGTYRWRIRWSGGGGYHGAGILDANSRDELTQHDWGKQFSRFELFNRSSSLGVQGDVYYRLDMDLRELQIRYPDRRVEILKGLPKEVWAGIVIKGNGTLVSASLFFDA